jgi:cyanophycinase-like exopeptidase
MSRRKPVFLIAGDPRSRHPAADPLLRKVFDNCAVSSPSVAYIGAANDDDHGFFGWSSTWLEKSGAGKVTLAPTVRSFERRFFEKTCESADAVLMSGGDVEAGMDVVTKRSLSPFLSELYRSGKFLFGLSAGSIMLARAWVRWKDDDSSAILFPCLGLANVLCDVHGEREDWDELKALLRLSPDRSIGYGIRAGSGMRVDPDGGVQPTGKVDRFVKQGEVVRQASR